jgi:hypothetical protein
MKSGRGGIRQGAGRKTTWASGCKQEDTKPIRVPKVIANQILEIAHKLDAGQVIDLDIQSKEETVTKSKLELKLSAVEKCLTKWRQLCSSKSSTEMQKLEQMLVELELIVWGKDLSVVNEVSELVTESSGGNKKDITELVTNSKELINSDSFSATPNGEELVTESKPLTYANQLELLNIQEELVLPKPIRCKPEPHSAVELAERLRTNKSNVSRYKTGKRKGGLLQWSLSRDPEGFGWEYSVELNKYLPVEISDSVTK